MFKRVLGRVGLDKYLRKAGKEHLDRTSRSVAGPYLIHLNQIINLNQNNRK